ncbi:CoA pyrophosphatase [Pantoea cypripedii]|uniref:CoA pyrophosphatase n=1 Tax=Pantoea cypripedii TaxID=55209 RepID=A0A6B9G974_PANCY|nr:CoA pyrophosphatase [Pantoea cypripedii]QGY29459.1 CoA pyrophosphatase [Pantoea cypripedii]
MNGALTLDQFLSRFVLQPPLVAAKSVINGRRAAVLVPLIDAAEPGLLLTRRASHLRKHAGQVAFPGGMQDATDDSLIHTALREAQEEVGIHPDQVQVVGVLPAVISSTGFAVTPVVGIIPAGLPLSINPDEVESTFAMPLAEALRLSRYSDLTLRRGHRQHQVWLSWYEDYFIWGMTAGIIRALGQQIALPV